jgi:hypothetical protein
VIKFASCVAAKPNVSKWQLLKMKLELPTKQFTLLLTITLSKIVIDSLPPNHPEIANKPTCDEVPMHRFDRIVRQRTELLPIFSNKKPFVPRFDSITIIIIIIHLLGLAPAGYLAAPDNGP